MTDYFLDSSALLKRYLPERGTNWIQEVTSLRADNSIIVAQITQAEVVSAVSRRKRENHVTVRTARAIRLLVDRHLARQCLVIALSDHIIQRAEDLLENHPLRAYDSVQLASALESNDYLLANGLSGLIFVSADQRLLSVAATVGLLVDNPENYP